MKVQITARHDRKVSDETKQFMEAEIEELAKFYDSIISVQIVLDKEEHKGGSVDVVDIVADIDGKKKLVAKASEENLGKAFDSAKEKIISQLKKTNEIKKSHAGMPTSEFSAVKEED